jgi:hypothetical protein
MQRHKRDDFEYCDSDSVITDEGLKDMMKTKYDDLHTLLKTGIAMCNDQNPLLTACVYGKVNNKWELVLETENCVSGGFVNLPKIISYRNMFGYDNWWQDGRILSCYDDYFQEKYQKV